MNSQDDDQQPPDEEPKEETQSEQSDEEQRRVSPSSTAFSGIGRQYSQLFSQLYAPMLKNLTTGFKPINTANLFPHIKITNQLLPQFTMPVLRIDPAKLGIGAGLTEAIRRQQQATFAPIAELLAQQHKQWDSMFASLRSLAETFFPPNWKGVEHPEFDVIETILLDDGIPLAWVPNQATLQAMFDAPDAATRRRVIGRRWKGIVSSCEVVLGEVNHASLQRHQPFVAEVVCALREGHVSAAQALAANLLDSILRRNFSKSSFKVVTMNKKGGTRFDLDDYQARAAFTLAPIWRAYAEYWESQGDPIPRTFGRHPSAHAVSRTQYSRVNAVVALMLVTSLLKLLDWELTR